MDLQQSKLDEDKAAVAAAQDAVTTAEAALTAAETVESNDEAEFEKEQADNLAHPALTVLNQIETFCADPSNDVPTAAQTAIDGLVEQARSLINAELLASNTATLSPSVSSDPSDVAEETATPTPVPTFHGLAVTQDAGGGNAPPSPTPLGTGG
jgi:hypothetical protein